MKNSLLPAVILLTLTACATPVERPTVSTQDLARYQGLPLDEILKRGDDAILAAQESRLDFFAPQHVAEAQAALKEARAASNKGDRTAAVMATMQTEKIVEAAHALKQRVVSQLQEEVVLHEALQARRAEHVFPEEYKLVTNRLTALIADIGAGRTEKLAKDRAGLKTQMVELEVRVIREVALQDAKATLAAAKAKGADKLAPLTYKEATDTFSAAGAYIQDNPYAEALVALKGKQALFAARHAVEVSDAVKALEKAVKGSLELLVLEQERQLARIGRAMNHADVRDRAFVQQVDALATSVEEIATAAEKLPRLRAEMAALEQELGDERVRSKQLAEDLAAAINAAKSRAQAQESREPETPAAAPVTDETQVAQGKTPAAEADKQPAATPNDSTPAIAPAIGNTPAAEPLPAFSPGQPASQ